MKRTIKDKLKIELKAFTIIQSPKDYPDEYTVLIKKNKEYIENHIEVVTREVAVRNELDFGDDDSNKKFLEYIAGQEEPKYIGAYKRIAKDVYYRELNREL